MPNRVLPQFGYDQRISAAVLRHDGGVFETIDYNCLHFADHLVSGLTPTFESHACSEVHELVYAYLPSIH